MPYFLSLSVGWEPRVLDRHCSGVYTFGLPGQTFPDAAACVTGRDSIVINVPQTTQGPQCECAFRVHTLGARLYYESCLATACMNSNTPGHIEGKRKKGTQKMNTFLVPHSGARAPPDGHKIHNIKNKIFNSRWRLSRIMPTHFKLVCV